jgi:hypothetical protein
MINELKTPGESITHYSKYLSPSAISLTREHLAQALNAHKNRNTRKQVRREGGQSGSHGVLFLPARRRRQLRLEGEEASTEEGAAQAADREDHQQPRGAQERCER